MNNKEIILKEMFKLLKELWFEECKSHGNSSYNCDVCNYKEFCRTDTKEP